MDIDADLDAPFPPAAVFEEVVDLEGYPGWLDIVGRVRPADPDDGDPGPAWWVDLRAQLGPIRRSKRLRMVRTRAVAPAEVRFERRELDGRQHSRWVLGATVTPRDDGCRLAMHLHYGGSLWLPVLDRILRDEITRSRPRLVRAVEDRRAAAGP